jgi:2,4-dienoyl-CoA reductase-like NADH-dependent reductase (Old Yellow Enzyme family)
MTDPLFQPYKLNSTITLSNKIIMAPLTRCFADDDLVPTDLMAEYYGKRGDAGLIVSEATLIDPIAQGYPNTPGIYSQDQIQAWKKVTKKVHEKGGKIFCQLWHCGRVAHSFYSSQQAVAPSAIGCKGRVPRTDNLQYETPKALSHAEVKQTIQDYVQAAKNSIEAGFDGVEIHGANGYLIDQFMHQSSNQRHDEYGGSLENRKRFALEVVDGIIAAIGKDRTSIRLSPQAYAHMDHTQGDEETYKTLFKDLESRDIAYIHLGAFDDSIEYDYLQGKPSAFIRKNYSGTFITCGSYTVESARAAVETKKADLVALGRPFIANADLIQQIQSDNEIVEYDVAMLKSL